MSHHVSIISYQGKLDGPQLVQSKVWSDYSPSPAMYPNIQCMEDLPRFGGSLW